MGDFNLDFYQTQVLPSFLYSKYSLSQLISIATTNYDSILDHVYTNLDKKLIYMSGVLESYFFRIINLCLLVKAAIEA